MTDEYTPEDANVITLTDEEGKECSFEIIDETGVYIKFRLTFDKDLKTVRNR